MIAVQRTNPDVDPWLTTVGYWVGHIKEGGPWDYKRKESGYGPWDKIYCCSYANHTYQHRSAEFIGNYNYGFTRSILFNASQLRAGSYAAARFRSIDKQDWPAIDEGYYDANK